MSVSQIKICNLALIRVGADRISSINEDTKSAIVLNAIYELIRDSVLRAHPWNCATKRAILTPTADTPLFEFDFEYDFTADMLRPVDAFPEDIEFAVEGRKILCNEETLDMGYIFSNTDESSWDSNLADAVAWRLAAESAYSLTQSLSLAQGCEKAYKAILAEARSMDGMEGRRLKFIADTWTRSRKSRGPQSGQI